MPERLPTRQSRRLLPLVLLVAAAVLPACGGVGGGVAFSVNGHETTTDEFFDELRLLAANQPFRGLFFQDQTLLGDAAELRGGSPGSFKQVFIQQTMEIRIFLALMNDEFAARDLEITDDDREAAVDSFGSFDFTTGQQLTGDQVLADFPAEYRQMWIDDQARLNVLQSMFGSPEEFGAMVQEAATSAEIEVHSRFGTWDENNLVIIPPDGPATTTTTLPAGEPLPLP